MTYIETIASLFGLSMLFTPVAGVSFGDGVGIGTMNPWKYSGSTITISSTTASLRIPGLTNCDTIDTNGSGVFTCGTDTGGGGGGGLASTTPWTAGQLAMVLNNSTVTGVSTTTVTATSPLSFSNTVFKVGGSNSVLSLDTSGTWTGNAGTASALAANGSNCSAGNFPLGVDASGVVETCTDAWTEAENTAANYEQNLTAGDGLTRTVDDFDCDTASGSVFGCLSTSDWTTFNDSVDPTRTLTVAGTANQVTSSAGAQDLSANRTWTLSLPSHVIFPGNFQVTNATTTNATTTGSLYLTALNCTGNANGGALTVDANGLVACSDDNSGGGGSGGGSWSTTTSQVAGQLVNYPNNDTDVVAIGANSTTTSEFWFDPNNSRSRIPFASSTAMTIVSAYLTNLFIGADTIAEYIADTAGAMFTGNTETDITVTYDDADNTVDFVVDTLPNLTGTLDYDSGGTGTTTAPQGQLLYGGATAYQSVATSSVTCTGASGVSCTTHAMVGAGGSTIALSSIPNSSLANSTISGISLGSNLNSLTNDATLVGTSYNGSASISDWGIDLTNANTWTGKQNLYGTASSTLFSAHWLKVGATASTTIDTAGNVALPAAGTLTIPALTSALLLTDGNGLLAEYAGSSGVCTNQVPTSISAVGALGTCSSINNSWWSGTDLSVANGGTGLSTFGGTDHVLYTTAADTLASEAAFVYSATTDRLTVVNASTTDFTIAGTVKVPYETIGFTYATTSWTATTTIYLGPAMGAQVFDSAYCETTVGTLGVSLYDGTNRATPYIPTASTTINLNALTANNTFTKGETRRVDIGTPVSSPRQIACTFKFRYIDDA